MSLRLQRTFRRTLFERIPKPFKEEQDVKHHEYSITPETFAFKVELDDRPLARNLGSGPKTDSGTRPAHLLQQKRFNPLDYVFRNATNYPFRKSSPQEVFDRYPQTLLARLARLKHRPRKAKMLALDFIEDSLYNPNYGYFSKEVEIFHNDRPFDYSAIDDVDAFMTHWEAAYLKYDQVKTEDEGRTGAKPKKEQPVPATPVVAKPAVPARPKTIFKGRPASQAVARPSTAVGPPRKTSLANYAKIIHQQDLAATGGPPPSRRSLQLWHTPTELFLPHYGEALARYIIVNYKLNGSYPYEDLVIYEMGGGNGTLMCNVLAFIQRTEPDIYSRTQYKIIEISLLLVARQTEAAYRQKLLDHGLDTRKLQIHNKSIFDWDQTVENSCFFIALEVFDNFAHDVVRYDSASGVPHEGHVLVDDSGDFYQFYTPQLSTWTEAFLRLRESGPHALLPQVNSVRGRLRRAALLVPYLTDKDAIHPLLYLPLRMAWQNRLFPLKDNLTPGEFIPTRLLQFFHILKYRFPNHSLIASDFHSLTNTVPGYYNAPVVQTVINNQMVDVRSYMCHQGYFDIMFPTDFALASDLYSKTTGKIAKVELHRAFLELWADVDATTTKRGENPMLDFYKNVSFMTS